MSSSKGTKKRKTWRCDVCQIAVFDTYDEALDHEQSCQGNTEADIDALASAVARGTASGAITNSGVEGEEEEEEERGVGEAMFFGGVKNNHHGGRLMLNGDGASPTVSTPTVLALLASSRAANGADAGAGGGEGSNINNNNGGTAVNPGIVLPDVSAAGGANSTASNAALSNNTNTQQQLPTCTVIPKEHNEDEPEQQPAASNNIDETPQLSSPPRNSTTTHTPPPKRPRNKWRCDYCPAIFNEYDEATIHEQHCKKNNTAIPTALRHTPNNNNNNKGKLVNPNWKCDYCPAIFRTYDDALAHENECKLNLPQQKSVQQIGGVPATICIPTKVGLNESTVIETTIEGGGVNKIASSAASPTASNINGNKKRWNWRCDVCLVAVFESYEEALAHENQCKDVELGRHVKKAKALEGTMDNCVEQEVGEKEDVVVEKDTVVGEKVIQQQLPDRTVPQQQQQPQQEQLPKFQRSQVVQKETTVQKEREQLPQKKPVVPRKPPTAKESQPGLEKKRMEVRMEREREAEKERAEKAKQEAAQKTKKAKKAEKQKARKAAKEAAEKEEAKKKAAASPRTPVEGGSKNVFLSLKDDYYRTHMFAYFRKLGALKQVQRDVDEEKRIKEEAFIFFMNSGRKLVKYHDWKRPELGYSEVDEEYARRKVSDDIRRRLDQRNLWDVLVDEETESDESESEQSSAKSPPVEAVAPKKNHHSSIGNGTVGSEAQKKATEQPIAKEVVQREEIRQPTIQQPVPMQPLVQQPQMMVGVAQQQQMLQQSSKVVHQPIIHQLIGPQSHHQRQPIMVPTNAQQALFGNFLTMQQGAQHPRPALQPPTTNQTSSIQQGASKTTSVNNENIADKPSEQVIPKSDLGIHDYVFGTSFRNHAGTRKYHELASKKTALYQNARVFDKATIAASVVNEWRELDPPGRFLKSNGDKGHFVDVGNEKAIGKTKKILRAKPATPTKSDIEVNADSVPGRESTESRESTSLSPVNATANLKRNDGDVSITNEVIASIAQLAEEELEKDTEPPQATPTGKQRQAEPERKRGKLRPILTVLLLLVILSIAAFLSAPPYYQKRGLELLFVPALVVLTLLLSLGLTIAYTFFTLTSATITRRRQVARLFSKVLPFLAAALILVSVSLYLQPVMTVLHGMSSSMWTRFGPGAAFLALAPILLLLSFSMAMLVTHEGPHHHIEGSFFRETYNIFEDTLCGPSIPLAADDDSSLPTLRDYLSHPDGFHMAFAPAFFGFFAYFGCLSALEEGTGGLIVPPVAEKRNIDGDECTSLGLRSVAGASAGAMAATLLASGIDPTVAAEFTSKFTWGMVSDPPGVGGYVKGNRFEEAMVDFLLKEASKAKRADKASDAPMQFDEALIPCAVSGFDLLRMKGVILSSGSMAKAARASAGFPGLFQPVAWRENCDEKRWFPDKLLIDGGIRDGLGLAGLGAFGGEKKRIVNVVLGDFGFSGPSGIHSLPEGVNASSLVSISIAGTPMCGPWAMENGKRAVESAKKAMLMALDLPMEKGDGENHYVLRLDASKFLD